MPGGGGLVRFEFSGRTPWPAKLVTTLLFANLIGMFAVDYWVQHYAPRVPTAGSPFSLRLTPSVVAFVPSWLARYEERNLWLHFIFVGLLFAVFGLYALKGQVTIDVPRSHFPMNPLVIAALLVFLFILFWVVLSQFGWLRHSPPKVATAVSDEVSHVSQPLVGKRITIHGKFSLLGKVGPYIVLDNRQIVYLQNTKGSFTWGKPYSEMEGKLVAATGTLRFYHEPPTEPAERAVAVQHVSDFFYFEVESLQLRLIGQ